MNGTVTFAPIDFLVVALFIVALLALGFSAKLRSNTILQFLAAGRRLSLPLFVASLVSLWYGGILGIGEAVSDFGVGTWILFGVPYYAFAILYAIWLAPKVRNAPQLSIPERLQLRFGRSVAITGAALLLLLAVPAAHILMLGTLVQVFTGWNLYACILIGTAIGVSFLYRGGLLADARASLLAFVMMYVGFGAMVAWCLTHHPLVPTLSTLAPERLKWDGGTGILFVASLFIVGAWTFVDPGFHQRVASGADEATSRKGVLISVGFWFLFDVLSITTALYAVALNKNASGLDVFPAFANNVLPAGLKALFFCGMLGTIVSAMVGYSLISGATIGREIIGRLREGMDDVSLTRWSKVGIAAACAIAIGVIAIFSAVKIYSVVDLWTLWAGAVVGSLLIPVLVAYKFRAESDTPKQAGRLRPPVILLAMISGFAVALAWMIFGLRTGNETLAVMLERTASGYRLVLPSGDADTGTKISIGTLLPALLTSAVVIALGAGLSRRSQGAR